jgi:hypothetical protein
VVKVRRWRRLAIVGLLVMAAVIGVWATRRWTDTVPLRTPPGVPTQSVSFECGAPFGAATTRRAERALGAPYPLSAEPCAHRRARRNLVLAEIVLAGTSVLVLAAGGRRARSGGGPASPPG